MAGLVAKRFDLWRARRRACGAGRDSYSRGRVPGGGRRPEVRPVTELLKTPLHALHVSLGGRMVGFAGYELPVQYPTGILKEHLHTRAAAGLFDVSHMGQIALRPKSGALADAAAALERLVPMDVLGLAPGRQRYGLFTDAAGGILDDLMFANRGDHLLLVVNAACKAADLAHLEAGLGDAVRGGAAGAGAAGAAGAEGRGGAGRAQPGRGGHAVHGHPRARAWRRAGGGVALGLYRRGRLRDLARRARYARISRCGCWRARTCCRSGSGRAIRCGSRRGSASTATTSTPARRRSRRRWSGRSSRRGGRGGARAGGFPGAGAILGQIAAGAARRRVGLRPEGRAPMREGTELFADEAGEAVGAVTSGGFGPSLDAPVAMGYVPIALAAPGTRLFGRLRGRMLPVTVAKMPLISRATGGREGRRERC